MSRLDELTADDREALERYAVYIAAPERLCDIYGGPAGHPAAVMAMNRDAHALAALALRLLAALGG